MSKHSHLGSALTPESAFVSSNGEGLGDQIQEKSDRSTNFPKAVQHMMQWIQLFYTSFHCWIFTWKD